MSSRKTLIKKHYELIANSNRREELEDNKDTFLKRNESGVMIHVIFIRPFQWEERRNEWHGDELESIKECHETGKAIPLVWVRSLMVNTKMILDDDDIFHKTKDYPFDFKHGDIIKLAIISTNFFFYPKFTGNDGCYIIAKQGLSDYDLAIYPLDCRWEMQGAIMDTIRFDGNEKFPDAYENLLVDATICYPDEQMTEHIIDNIVPEIVKKRKHPMNIYNENRVYPEFKFVISRFKYGNYEYEVFFPFRLKLAYVNKSIIQKCIKQRMTSKLTCELISFDGSRYRLIVNDYVLVEGPEITMHDLLIKVWEYFDNQVLEEYPTKSELRQKLKGIEDQASALVILRKLTDEYGVKPITINALHRNDLRYSSENVNELQFKLEELDARVYSIQ